MQRSQAYFKFKWIDIFDFKRREFKGRQKEWMQVPTVKMFKTTEIEPSSRPDRSPEVTANKSRKSLKRFFEIGEDG